MESPVTLFLEQHTPCPTRSDDQDFGDLRYDFRTHTLLKKYVSEQVCSFWLALAEQLVSDRHLSVGYLLMMQQIRYVNLILI